MWCRGLLLFLILFVASPIEDEVHAQNFFDPRVQVQTKGVDPLEESRIKGLEQKIVSYLKAYTPPISLPLTPIHSIPLYITLTLEEEGGDYLGALQIQAYRPIYNTLDTSLLFFFFEPRFRFSKPSLSYITAYSGTALPQDELYLRLSYYALLIGAYYYDSFALNGGEAFWNHLQSYAQEYAQLWKASSSEDISFLLNPLTLLLEINSVDGEKLRELWFLYHLSVLDAISSRVSHASLDESTNFIGVLTSLSELTSRGLIPSLIQLTNDAKRTEFMALSKRIPLSLQTKVDEALHHLYPTL